MKKNVIAIMANGERVNNIRKILKDVDVIIAADGGANICRADSITPDYIVGDLDSITLENIKYFSEPKFVKINDQSNTDLQKAIDHALKLNPTSIKIVAALGNRTDHTLANILIFQNYNELIPLEIYDNFGVMKLYSPGSHNIALSIGQTISFFSLTSIEGLSLKGFKYPVNDADYSNNFIGISNIVMEQNCAINFKMGKLISYTIEVWHSY
ncbi:MAG: thiamine diphosphokinase [Candidatus Cloacimonetes bacterium]|nr:thiamine diphosphokinase [Candidatus Cloacimonadota bacterium]